MSNFNADPADLADRVAYDLDVLEYLRTTLDSQREVPIGGVTLTIGDLTPEGEQRRAARVVGSSRISDGAVRAALGRFRPLAFGAAFKLQDMIAEWILRENGENAWRFVEKLRAYDRLRSAGQLSEPGLFAQKPPVARAFWELYRFFNPFRNSATHAGGVILAPDGTISISSRNNILSLSPAQQGAYVRAMCVAAKILSEQAKRDPFLDDLLEGDLHVLATYHSQSGLVVRGARIEALTAYVPLNHLVDDSPFAVRIDFDHLRAVMERSFPPPADGRLWFSATIIAPHASGEYTWELPIEAVPSGTVTIQQGDPAFDRFLKVAAIAAPKA